MSTLPKQLERVVFKLLEDTDTPVSLGVYLRLKYGEVAQLLDMSVEPKHYLHPGNYYDDVVAVDFLKKYKGFVLHDRDLDEEARESFRDCERTCLKTNIRLLPFIHNGPFEDPSDLRLFESIERMQRWFQSTLGKIPEDLFNSRFGPGATFRDVGKHTTVPDKITNRPTITSGAEFLLPLWERTWWARAYQEVNPQFGRPEQIRGNRFTTVDKKATQKRGIAIEASINVYFQLGVGKALRQSLKSVGIDLIHGQDVHRQVACEASRRGNYATVDLKNASNLVARNCVKLLLQKCEGWFDLVDGLRSTCTQLNGKWQVLQMFSSMGNGYTFELETLVFLAIALEACYLSNVQATPGVNLFVYGDDIILPVKAGATLLTLLRWFGFQPNLSKTFLEGQFRESCGGDFFNGEAVRPFYLKEDPDEPAKWIALANGIRRLGRKDSGSDFRYSIYWRTWLCALDAVPSDLRRLRGPENLGDLVIHDEREFWQRRRTPDQRTYIRTWSPIHKAIPLHHWKGPIVFASALYGIPSDGPIPRSDVEGYRKRWVSYPE